MLNNMKKKKERKVAHTFKGNHQKERESCSKEYKIFRIRKISKFHTLAVGAESDQCFVVRCDRMWPSTQ